MRSNYHAKTVKSRSWCWVTVDTLNPERPLEGQPEALTTLPPVGVVESVPDQWQFGLAGKASLDVKAE